MTPVATLAGRRVALFGLGGSGLSSLVVYVDGEPVISIAGYREIAPYIRTPSVRRPLHGSKAMASTRPSRGTMTSVQAWVPP